MSKSSNRTKKTPLEENIKFIKSKVSSCKNPPVELVQLVERLHVAPTSDAAKSVVTYDPCNFPGPRRFFSLAYNDKNMYFYGGEHDDGKNVKVFSDTIIVNLKQIESCKQLTSQVFPFLRSGHAMASFEGGFFIHGGEFLFDDINFCYNDLWFFDYAKKRWSEIELTGNVPSARSGHRMTYHQGILFISCGYSMLLNGDISVYHNDLYAIKPTTGECRQINVQMKGRIFNSRSGCLLTTWNNKILVLGGYSLLSLSDSNLQGCLSNEMWQSDISDVLRTFSEHSNQVLPAQLECIRWEKISKTFFYRCASAYTVNKGQLYMFGGVVDDDRGGLNHQVTFFFNDITCIDLANKTFASVSHKDQEGTMTAFCWNNNSFEQVEIPIPELQRVYLKNKKTNAPIVYNTIRSFEQSSLKKTFEELNMPVPRIGASIFYVNKCIYLFGGSLEVSKKNMMLNDFWKFDLQSSTWTLLSKSTEAEPNKNFNDDESDTEGSDESSSEDADFCSSEE